MLHVVDRKDVPYVSKQPIMQDGACGGGELRLSKLQWQKDEWKKGT
ncbi:hypothetical protein LINGRAHAP2_LOCUS5216 [Linum grandiflorum]